MISPKFYSQITVCPACSGWGVEGSPPKKNMNSCKECLGQGVSVVQSENIYIFDAPTFIDYGRRSKVAVFKIGATTLAITVIFLALLVVRSIALKIMGG